MRDTFVDGILWGLRGGRPMKRWKVTTRTVRGSYGTRFFFFKRRADRFAHDYESRGLGTAKVVKA